MEIKRTETATVLLISLMFLMQMLVIAHAEVTEDKVAALESRIEALETELESVRVISFSLAMLALVVAVMIPIYPRFKQSAKPAKK